MKARSGKLGNFVMTVLLLGIGAGLLYGSVWDRDVGKIIADTLAIPLAAGGLGTILILSVVLRWVGGCGRRKEAFIDYQSEEGNVGISTKAIQDFVARVGREFAAVRDIDTRLIHGKGALDIAVSVSVVSGNKIPELSQVLQQRIRESVRESLGLAEIGKITVQVKEIVGAPEKHASSDDELTQ